MLFEHSMAFSLTKPIWALICLHDVTQESVATLTDHFANAFVRTKRCTLLCCCGDIKTFECFTLTPFGLEKFSVRKGIF